MRAGLRDGRGHGGPGSWGVVIHLSHACHNMSATSVKIQGWRDGSQPLMGRAKNLGNRLSWVVLGWHAVGDRANRQ
jgi:hypothetical protein